MKEAINHLNRMIRKKYLSSLFFALLTLLSVQVVAQDDDLEKENECVRTLARAQQLFKDGLIEKVEQELKPCLEGNQLSKEDKLAAYKLLIESKLYDDKDAEAQKAMVDFLTTDPEYVPQSGVDSKEFMELYSSYQTSPLYTLGGYGGINWAAAQSYSEFGAYNTESDKKVYSSSLGFLAGLRASRHLYKGLNVHLDLGFEQSSFEYTHDVLEGFTFVDPSGDKIANYSKAATITATESQSVFYIPLSFSYTFLMNKQWRPYVIAGMEMRMLINASLGLKKDFLDDNIADVEVPDIANFKSQRNGSTLSASFGAGVKYKVSGGDFFFEAKYLMGISDQVKADAVDINNDQRLWTFYDQDNKFTLNHTSIAVGYNYYFYKPRKLKKNKSEESMLKEQKTKKVKEEKVKEEKPKKEVEKTEGDKKRQVIE